METEPRTHWSLPAFTGSLRSACEPLCAAMSDFFSEGISYPLDNHWDMSDMGSFEMGGVPLGGANGGLGWMNACEK